MRDRSSFLVNRIQMEINSAAIIRVHIYIQIGVTHENVFSGSYMVDVLYDPGPQLTSYLVESGKSTD